MHSQTLRARMARGVSWAFVSTACSQVVTSAASILLARILGKEGFGQLGIIYSTIGFLSVFGGLSLGTAATKYTAQLKENDKERPGRILGLSMLLTTGVGGALAIGTAAGARWISSGLLAAPAMDKSLRLASFLLVAGGVNGTQVGALAGLSRFREAAAISVWRSVLQVPLMITGALMAGLDGAVAGLALSGAAAILIGMRYVRKCLAQAGVRIRYRGASAELSVLRTFSLPVTLSGLATLSVTWRASAFLANQPGGYGQVGLFSAANQWRSAILMLTSVLTQPLMTFLSELRGSGRQRDQRRLLTKTTLAVTGITAVAGLVIVVCSPMLLKLYGKQFADAQVALVLIVAAAVLNTPSFIVCQGMVSADRMWAGFWLSALWAGTMVASGLALIPTYGAVGLSGAYLLAYLVQLAGVGVYIAAFTQRLPRLSVGQLLPGTGDMGR